jgi:hypothetical protein
MWKLLLIPIVLVGLAIGFAACWAAVETLQSTEYTYRGSSEVTLEQYNTVSEAVGDGEKLDIVDVRDSKLGIKYDFKSFLKYDFISFASQEFPIWTEIVLCGMGLFAFLMCFVGIRDIYNSVKESVSK